MYFCIYFDSSHHSVHKNSCIYVISPFKLLGATSRRFLGIDAALVASLTFAASMSLVGQSRSAVYPSAFRGGTRSLCGVHTERRNQFQPYCRTLSMYALFCTGQCILVSVFIFWRHARTCWSREGLHADKSGSKVRFRNCCTGFAFSLSNLSFFFLLRTYQEPLPCDTLVV